jgi:hypothetical protein
MTGISRVFPIGNGSHRAIIQSWFCSLIDCTAPGLYADLHVDQIDPVWKPRSAWISSALESFEIALEVRDAQPPDRHQTIILAFALESYVRPLGITFHSREDLEDNFSSTSPSLCVFRPGGEFWARVTESKKAAATHDVVIRPLSAKELFGEELNRSIECVYLEHKRLDDEEYSRLVFLAG